MILKLLRGALLTILLLSPALAAESCVELYGLEGYTGAADSLCKLLEECRGTDYDACFDHVSAGLNGADPALRTSWLSYFADANCLENCTNGQRCLDEAPICQGPGSGCGSEAQCCGFSKGGGHCAAGSCCLTDGKICQSDSDCCTGSCRLSSPDVTTCGGTVCAEIAEPCKFDSDCCSSSCAEGLCVHVCAPNDDPCQLPGDCCSGQCVEGYCQCLPDEHSCEQSEQCCSQLCDGGGLCSSSSGCLTSGLSCGGPPGLPCCPGLDCEAGQCCGGQQTLCTEGSQCCAGGCQQNHCCSGWDAPCTEGECCFGACDGGSCQCLLADQECDAQQDCCGLLCYPPPTWGSSHPSTCRACAAEPDCQGPPCAPGGPPVGYSAGTISVCGGEGPMGGCIEAVCQALPYCCCEVWDEACVALVSDLSTVQGEACFEVCNATT